MKSFHVTHMVTHPSGESFTVETNGNSETAEDARYYAVTMLEDRFSIENGWTFQEVKCVENTEDIAALNALLSDIKIDL